MRKLRVVAADFIGVFFFHMSYMFLRSWAPNSCIGMNICREAGNWVALVDKKHVQKTGPDFYRGTNLRQGPGKV